MNSKKSTSTASKAAPKARDLKPKKGVKGGAKLSSTFKW